MIRSTLYVVKCPEVMDVNEHVLCFDNYNAWVWLHTPCSQFSGLTIYITCVENYWIYSVCVVIKVSFPFGGIICFCVCVPSPEVETDIMNMINDLGMSLFTEASCCLTFILA